MPHTMLWIAKASENTSRVQPCSTLIGCRNRPKVARTPIAISRMATAAARTHSGRREEFKAKDDQRKAAGFYVTPSLYCRPLPVVQWIEQVPPKR